jgi:hypothetical protein
MATWSCSDWYYGLSWSPANLNSISEDTTTTGSCSPKIITITLDANWWTLWTETFYYKYNTAKYYSDSSLTTEITSTTRPTRAW